jgi:N-acetylneuraminate synthase
MMHCKIIADVGSNWLDLADCMESITRCSADIVKFQYFTSEKLWGDSNRFVKELPKAWIPILHRICWENGKGFMCSVFDWRDVSFIDNFVEIHKIASAEITDENILKAVADTGKTTLISVGMGDMDVITRALSFFDKGKAVLLYCEAMYPSRYHFLDNIKTLAAKFGCEVGYSDHSLDVFQAPYDAVKNYRVPYLEKHYGLNRIIDQCQTDDYGHSLDEMQLEEMVHLIMTGEMKRHIDTTHRRVKKDAEWKRPR